MRTSTFGSAPDEAGIVTIDCDYVLPRAAVAYLMLEGSEAAFIETNTTHAVPRLLAALRANGRAPEDVRYIIITHVHLDHAGGTAALLAACPHATVLAHPKAAPHLIDPTRLVTSSRQVYGDELFEKLYGTIQAVSAERVRIMADDEHLDFGSRRLRFLYTRGHADHHFCIYDSKSNGIFTGDAFGIGYADLQRPGRPFLYPSTTPTQFDAEEARATVTRICATGARRAYLTHSGAFEDLAAGAEQMRAGLDVIEGILRAATSTTESDLQQFCEQHMRAYFTEKLQSAGLQAGQDEWALLNLDVSINAMGIAYQAGRLRKKLTQGGPHQS